MEMMFIHNLLIVKQREGHHEMLKVVDMFSLIVLIVLKDWTYLESWKSHFAFKRVVLETIQMTVF